MKKQRWFVLLTAVLLLVTTFSGCNGKNRKPDPGTGTLSPSQSESDPVSDRLPTVDYDGYSFRLYTRGCCPQHVSGLYSEDMGDTVGNGVFTRNSVVEERYSIFIEEPMTGPDAIPQDLMVALQSGTDACDVTVLQLYYSGYLAINGLLVDQNQLPYQDFTQEWWSDLTYAYELDDKIYTSYGCIDTDNITMLGCIYFNRDLFHNTFPDTNLYQLVREKKWTLDVFAEFIEEGSRDLNQDGNMTYGEDLFGMATYVGYLSQYLAASEIAITTRDDDGTPYYTVYSQKTERLYDKLCELFFDSDAVYWDEVGSPKQFIAGKELFHAGTLETGRSALRNMEQNWGILPYPIWSETQSGYHCRPVPHAPLIGVPINNTNNERTSLILEALVMYGNEYIRPALYETVLQNQMVRDQDTPEMIDIIYHTSTADFADIYGGWTHFGLILDMSVRERNSSLSTYYNRHLIEYQEELRKSIDYFRGGFEQ